MRKGWYSFFLVGFSEGFAIHYDSLRESSDAKNVILALENPDVVDIKIKKELDAGRCLVLSLLIPFTLSAFLPKELC